MDPRARWCNTCHTQQEEHVNRITSGMNWYCGPGGTTHMEMYVPFYIGQCRPGCGKFHLNTELVCQDCTWRRNSSMLGHVRGYIVRRLRFPTVNTTPSIQLLRGVGIASWEAIIAKAHMASQTGGRVALQIEEKSKKDATKMVWKSVKNERIECKVLDEKSNQNVWTSWNIMSGTCLVCKLNHSRPKNSVPVMIGYEQSTRICERNATLMDGNCIMYVRIPHEIRVLRDSIWKEITSELLNTSIIVELQNIRLIAHLKIPQENKIVFLPEKNLDTRRIEQLIEKRGQLIKQIMREHEHLLSSNSINMMSDDPLNAALSTHVFRLAKPSLVPAQKIISEYHLPSAARDMLILEGPKTEEQCEMIIKDGVLAKYQKKALGKPGPRMISSCAAEDAQNTLA